MPSETAYDTALAASKAAARSVTRSPSSGSTGTKLVEPVEHIMTGEERVQDGANDHSNNAPLDDDEETDKAIFESFIRAGSTRSPSPAITETMLKSTPPAETDHLDHENEVVVEKPSEEKGHAQSTIAHTTPQCQMTGEELGSLRKPGDSVTTKEGHTVQLVEDSQGRRLFKSQISSTMPPTSYQQPPSESSKSVRFSSQSQKKRHKRVSMLASIDPSNIIDMTDAEEEEEESRLGTPPTSSMPPSSYSLRNRRAPQGKLIYDAKYHPMDDSIRPSQAAKRRFAHGEIELSSDEENGTFSVHSESEGDEEEQETEKILKKFRTSKSKKRSRSRSESLQPTRRSSRRHSNQKVFYNMNVHPQDRFLEVSSSDDEDSDASLHRDKRPKTSRSRRIDPVPSPKHLTKATVTVIADSEVEDEDEEEEEGDEEDEETAYGKANDGQSDEGTIRGQVPHQSPTLTSPMPDVTTPPSFGIRRADELGIYLRDHGDLTFSRDRDSWPVKPGLPFEIHSEHLEDQLAAEAEAASPFDYDEDDKENDTLGDRLGHTPDPIEGMSVVPLSQYRSARAENDGFLHPAASAAFYDAVHRSFSPYNLGGNDGSDDQDIAMKKARSDSKDVREQQKGNTSEVTERSSRPVEGANQGKEVRAFTPINPKS